MKLYREYLQHNVLPVALDLQSKYAEWWSFQPGSSLKTYLEENNVFLDDYFIPGALFDAVQHIVYDKKMIDPGNSQLIHVNDPMLRQCFGNVESFYKSELKNLVKTHITVLSDNLLCHQLQKNIIKQEIYIETPKDLIYCNPFSKFWVAPELNYLLNKTNQHQTYSWSQLCLMFFDFCLNNDQHVRSVQKDQFKICSNSMLNTLFNFKEFNRYQIPTILEHCTLFLGQTKNLQTCCPMLKLSVQDNNFFNVIEYPILTCNKYLPYLQYSISI